jgi:hypothetical protein
LIHHQGFGPTQIVSPDFCRVVTWNVSRYHRRTEGNIGPGSDRGRTFAVVFLRRRTRAPPRWRRVRVDLPDHVLRRGRGRPRAHSRSPGYHPRMWNPVGVRRGWGRPSGGEGRARTLQRWRVLVGTSAQVTARTGWNPRGRVVARHWPVPWVAIVGNVAVDRMRRRRLL